MLIQMLLQLSKFLQVFQHYINKIIYNKDYKGTVHQDVLW